MKKLLFVCGMVGLAATLVGMQGPVQAVQAQGRGGAGGGRGNQPPPTAKAGAPFDPTGYWVSLITNSWRVRMVPPPAGDYSSIPLTAEARKVADAWDPAKDEAAKLECKYYGAASIMWQPTRIHITWQDDQTLKLETDAGTQTRILKFASAPAAAAGAANIVGASARATGRPAELAGRLGRGVGVAAPRRRRRRGWRPWWCCCSRYGEIPQGHDDQHARRVPSQERHPVQ